MGFLESGWQTGSWPETGFEENNVDLLEADFETTSSESALNVTSGLLVIRPESLAGIELAVDANCQLMQSPAIRWISGKRYSYRTIAAVQLYVRVRQTVGRNERDLAGNRSSGSRSDSRALRRRR